MNVKQLFLNRYLWCVSLLTFAGCSQIPLRSLWALRHLDLATLDVAQVRLLAALPVAAQTPRDALQVDVKIARGNGSAEILNETLTLRADAAALPAQRPAAAEPGVHWVALTFDADEQRRWQALRQRAAVWKAADGPSVKRQLTLSLHPHLCTRGARSLAVADLRISAWLRWQAGQDDVPLIDRAKLVDLDDELVRQGVPACA